MLTNIMGAEVHWEMFGDTGSRVVLLHGWGCKTALMEPVAKALCKDHRVLVLDFPGHGESSRPPEPWGIPEYAACLKTLLRQLDFLPCAAVGHSFGCRVAAWLAAEDPDCFTRLALTGAAGLKKPQTEADRKRTEQYKRWKSIAEKAEKTKLFGALPQKALEQLRKTYGSADYNALDEEMRKTFVKVINQDLRECYPKIRQPVLLLWGDKDTETPLWMGQEMEKLIPDAGLVILENGTHFAYLEQLGRFNTILSNFLTEV